MKIKVELDEQLKEEEVIIRCRSLTREVQEIQKAVSELTSKKQGFAFYKGETEYYLPLEAILFFETEEKVVCAHTKDQVYQVRHRLYELEELLPGYFMRVSKSTILNTDQVFSISKNLAASSVVEFMFTHKQVYVSRHYYKALKLKLEEKRNLR
ncbi:MAG: LytTR family transcriptional regulator [Lachnospiraceae bacterium]|nr:LytTR family transcriptional regulator [Lachnospiraceae bacterium]